MLVTYYAIHKTYNVSEVTTVDRQFYLPFLISAMTTFNGSQQSVFLFFLFSFLLVFYHSCLRVTVMRLLTVTLTANPPHHSDQVGALPVEKMHSPRHQLCRIPLRLTRQVVAWCLHLLNPLKGMGKQTPCWTKFGNVKFHYKIIQVHHSIFGTPVIQFLTNSADLSLCCA